MDSDWLVYVFCQFFGTNYQIFIWVAKYLDQKLSYWQFVAKLQKQSRRGYLFPFVYHLCSSLSQVIVLAIEKMSLVSEILFFALQSSARAWKQAIPFVIKSTVIIESLENIGLRQEWSFLTKGPLAA